MIAGTSGSTRLGGYNRKPGRISPRRRISLGGGASPISVTFSHKFPKRYSRRQELPKA